MSKLSAAPGQKRCDACHHLIGPRQGYQHTPPDEDYHEQCFVGVTIKDGVVEIYHCPDKIKVIILPALALIPIPNPCWDKPEAE